MAAHQQRTLRDFVHEETMAQQFCSGRDFGLLLLFVVIGSSLSGAQTVTPVQQASCDRHHEPERCQQLVKEFGMDHGLLAANPAVPLDLPWGDTVAFRNKIAPKAILLQLSGDLKAEAEQAKQEALQIISTSAAVTQLGGSPSAGGSTNLVTKPTNTDFLSVAAESGGFTDTLNGNAFTLQANALGLTKYLANQPVFA